MWQPIAAVLSLAAILDGIDGGFHDTMMTANLKCAHNFFTLPVTQKDFIHKIIALFVLQEVARCLGS